MIARRVLATLKQFDGAEDSFHLPAHSGTEHSELVTELLDTLAAWIDRVI